MRVLKFHKIVTISSEPLSGDCNSLWSFRAFEIAEVSATHRGARFIIIFFGAHPCFCFNEECKSILPLPLFSIHSVTFVCFCLFSDFAFFFLFSQSNTVWVMDALCELLH